MYSVDSLLRCNATELYQLCRKAKLAVLPSASKEEMAALLIGELEPIEEYHNIDSWRIALMQFVLDYWRKLETQITCPAKSRDPRACFQCTDAQVITCVVDAEAHEDLIQLRRPTNA